jgi:hypothetical protein
LVGEGGGEDACFLVGSGGVYFVVTGTGFLKTGACFLTTGLLKYLKAGAGFLTTGAGLIGFMGYQLELE